tara:strand:- start:444 stop:1961 length:1518 start_codon:yes stop_codon:yes gene_type:complete
VDVSKEGTTEHFKQLLAEEMKRQEEMAAAKLNDLPDYEIELRMLARRCQYIPLRLTDKERTFLHILEGALEISEYTDNVDVSSNPFGWRMMFSSYSSSSSKDQTIRKELQEFFTYVHSLFVCANFRAGSKLISNRTFEDNARFLAEVFEVGRRYKIMNPNKMRTSYGKLMHILMDTATENVIDYPVITDIKTVASVLSSKCEGLLNDPLLIEATRSTHGDVVPGAKKQATEMLCKKYVSEEFPREVFMRVLDSISDSNSYIYYNRDPVDQMIQYLQNYFEEGSCTKYTNLEIRYGSEGCKLSHGHTTQYRFVLQSLMLWREIQHEMYYLWMQADNDLLNSRNPYRLSNTGQGLNRVQPAPNVSHAMSKVLGTVKSRLGGWVGLSVVHLGDRDVPNALTFIDKYTQVPRILGPIVNTIEHLQQIYDDNEELADWIDKHFGGVEQARVRILRDFFRLGFNGSGDDGGSCVDGRLTSAWNWCSKLDKKSVFPLFMLAGFEGFDGSFKR